MSLVVPAVTQCWYQSHRLATFTQSASLMSIVFGRQCSRIACNVILKICSSNDMMMITSYISCCCVPCKDLVLVAKAFQAQ